MRTTKALCLLPLMLNVGGFAQTSVRSKSPAIPSTHAVERFICHLDPSKMAESPVSSPDSRRVAYIAAGSQFVVVNDVREKTFDGIAPDSLVFSQTEGGWPIQGHWGRSSSS